MSKVMYYVFKRVLLGLLACLLLTGGAFASINDMKIFELCQKGTLQQIKDAINNGANVNARFPITGATPLMWAAGYNPDPEVIVALVNAGADVNEKSISGATSLDWAITHNPNLEVITALVKSGFDVNLQNENGMTPLMDVVRYSSNPEVIKALVRVGADVNAQGGFTRATSLMRAAKYNTNPEFITTLLELGADPKMKDYFGEMAIDYAKNNKALKNTEALRRLEELSK